MFPSITSVAGLIMAFTSISFTTDFAEEDITSLVDSKPNRYSTDGNANEFANKLLTKLQHFLSKNYEPLEMGTYKYIKWIKMKGLSTLYRSADTTVTHKGKEIIVKVNLGFHHLITDASFEKNIWWQFWIKGIIHIDVEEIRIYGVLKVNLNKNIIPHLDEFSITDWGTTKVTFHGHNLIGKIVAFFQNIFPITLETFVKNTLPRFVNNGINDALKRIDLGIETLTTH